MSGSGRQVWKNLHTEFSVTVDEKLRKPILPLDGIATVAIRNEKLKRVIRMEKSGSKSTAFWHPWTTQKLPENWGTNEHLHMVRVESDNVKQNKVSLAPGKSPVLKVIVSSAAI